MSNNETFQILNSFLKNYNLREEDVNRISGSLDILKLKKGEYFSKKGEICKKIGILINGYLVARYERDNGRKQEKVIVTSRFYYMPELPRNPIVCDFKSFYNGSRSEENIKAEEDCQLFIITKEKLDKLYNEIPEMNKLGRIFAEQSYISALERTHALQLKNESKKEYFNKEFSVLLGKAKINDIASYLGMDRKSYNNLRNKVKN